MVVLILIQISHIIKVVIIVAHENEHVTFTVCKDVDVKLWPLRSGYLFAKVVKTVLDGCDLHFAISNSDLYSICDDCQRGKVRDFISLSLIIK